MQVELALAYDYLVSVTFNSPPLTRFTAYVTPFFDRLLICLPPAYGLIPQSPPPMVLPFSSFRRGGIIFTPLVLSNQNSVNVFMTGIVMDTGRFHDTNQSPLSVVVVNRSR